MKRNIKIFILIFGLILAIGAWFLPGDLRTLAVFAVIVIALWGSHDTNKNQKKD